VAVEKNMVTLRRTGSAVSVVTWGNADQAMLELRDAILLGFAKAGSGTVVTEEGRWSAEAFEEQFRQS
jgi:hypothetical protein